MASGFNINGSDIEGQYISKSYLLDRYPEIANQFKSAGVWAWGYNNYGQLGTNDRTNRSSPVQTVAGGSNWKQVECGSLVSGGIKTDGTLWVWGKNFFGGLGTNDRTPRSSPVQTVAGGTDWKQISVGGNEGGVAAIKTNGTLWNWGVNNYGDLGTNNITYYSSPVQTISGGTNWKFVSKSLQHTIAIKTDGTAWSWGKNWYGQLGNNTSTGYIPNRGVSSPVQVVGGGAGWKIVSAGPGGVGHSAGIKTDGTLWCWGYGGFGTIGNNTLNNYSSPVQTISGGTNWKQVTCGYYTTHAIKTDGTLWGWGYNSAQYSLGTNDKVNYSSPVQTVAGGTNWYSISTSDGNGGPMAIKTDGTLWTWGKNGYGTNLTGNTTDTSSPVQVTTYTNWKSAVGGSTVIAIRDDSMELNFGAGTL
jgi:alpha-tubulin suppressor-like RCC1 family protein